MSLFLVSKCHYAHNGLGLEYTKLVLLLSAAALTFFYLDHLSNPHIGTGCQDKLTDLPTSLPDFHSSPLAVQSPH